MFILAIVTCSGHCTVGVCISGFGWCIVVVAFMYVVCSYVHLFILQGGSIVHCWWKYNLCAIVFKRGSTVLFRVHLHGTQFAMLVIISSSRAFSIVRSCFVISTRGGQLYYWNYVLLIASNNVSQLQQSLRNNFERAFDGPFVAVHF